MQDIVFTTISVSQKNPFHTDSCGDAFQNDIPPRTVQRQPRDLRAFWFVVGDRGTGRSFLPLAETKTGVVRMSGHAVCRRPLLAMSGSESERGNMTGIGA